MKDTGTTSKLETTIGLYWLHRLGIISLVLGLAFLLMYSFQFFGAQIKLLTGAVAACSLLVCGGVMAKKEKQKWFADGLTAAGWSIAYFTAYAAHFLPSLRVIDSLPVEIVLLMTVAAGSFLSSLRARSELMAIYSVTLASATIFMSEPGLGSDVSFLIIAFTASLLGNIRSWNKLFAFAMIACYIGHVSCSMHTTTQFEKLLSPAFLGAIWLVFSVGIGYAVHRGEEAKRNVRAVLTCVNAVSLSIGLLFFNSAGEPEVSQLLLVGAGSVYLAAARWLGNRSETQMQTVHSLVGLSLINLAKLLHFSGLTLVCLDIVEIALLGAIAIRCDIKGFRWFSRALTLVLFPLWLFTLVVHGNDMFMGFQCFALVEIGFWAVAVLGGLSWLHTRTTSSSIALPGANDADHCFFFFAANLMIFLVIGNLTAPGLVCSALVLQTVANGLLLQRLSRNYYGYLSAGLLAISSCWLIGLVVGIRTIETSEIASVLTLLYFAHAYGRSAADRSLPGSFLRKLNVAYAQVANVALTLFILKLVPPTYLSLSLGVEGAALLACGFALRDRFFRIPGLLVLAVLTGKLLFVDIANYNTLGRILSFIGAGVVFLLASHGYARFTRAFDDEPKPDCESPAAADHVTPGELIASRDAV